MNLVGAKKWILARPPQELIDIGRRLGITVTLGKKAKLGYIKRLGKSHGLMVWVAQEAKTVAKHIKKFFDVIMR